MSAGGRDIHLRVRLQPQFPLLSFLSGPPTLFCPGRCCARADEYGAALHVLTSARVLGAYVGESERRLRGAFEAAQRDADAGRTAVVFMDEVCVGAGEWVCEGGG